MPLDLAITGSSSVDQLTSFGGMVRVGRSAPCRDGDACAEFKAAKPKLVPRTSPADRRLKGESYKTEVYDDLVPHLLARASVGARTMTQVVEGLASHPETTFTLARIERDRGAALRTYRQDRDSVALDLAMKRLDAKEDQARASTQVISTDEAVARLQDLPAFWVAADDSGRRLLTQALFEKVDVLRGEVRDHPPDARDRCSQMDGCIQPHAATHPGRDGCRCNRYGWSGREG
jgi:hypothetical protein